MAAEQQMEMKGCVRRIKSCAFDLISVGNELMEEEEEDFESEDDDAVMTSWDLIERELSLKSTFLYCDFSKMISLAPDPDHKTTLTHLGNRLFDSIEEVDNAVKTRRIELTQDRYSQALVVLRDVVTLMP